MGNRPIRAIMRLSHEEDMRRLRKALQAALLLLACTVWAAGVLAEPGGKATLLAINDVYRIEGISAFVLIDPEGNIVQRYHWIDFPPETHFLDLIEAHLEEALGT